MGKAAVAAPGEQAAAPSVPAELAAHGWKLEHRRDGWVCVVAIDGDPCHTKPRRRPEESIDDAKWMDQQLALEAM
jgi:hypothetical protein